MGEDDIVELLWKSGHVVRSCTTQTPSVPPPILLGSGSGGGGGEGEEIAPLPPPPPPHTQQPPSDQNLFIREDEMASWLHHHPLGEGDLFYTNPFTQPQGFLSLTPPPPPPASVMYTPTATAAERPMGQVMASRRAENFINFARLRENIYAGEPAAPWVPPVVKDLTQVGSNTTPSSSAAESCLTPATLTRGVLQSFAVPSLGRKAVETVCEIAVPSSSVVVSKTDTELLQITPVLSETETADDRKRKERQEPADETEGTGEEAAHGSTSRKRSRAAEMHNISERRRREKINEKMKALQELIPRCNKTDKASMLEDAIEYVKSLQMQIQMMSMGGGGMMPMMYTPSTQRFMPQAAMGMMGMNRPPFIPFPGTAFPRPAHMAGLDPSYPAPRYPIPNIQAADPSRVHLPSQQAIDPSPSQQPDPVPNQPPFPGYLNPYSQFVGLQQIQQQPPPPRLQSQTTSQLSFSQARGSKEPEDQENKPTG